MERVNSMTRKSHQRKSFFSTDKASKSVLVRSLLAIQCVSKADLHEIRSIQNPPYAILMSFSNLLIVLLRDNNG
jgi:hypothetical protein